MTRRTLLLVAAAAGIVTAGLVALALVITRPAPAGTATQTPTTATRSAATSGAARPVATTAEPPTSTSEPESPSLAIGRHGPPRLSGHQLTDPDTVALTAAGGLSGFDAEHDPDQYAAAHRIAYLLTDDLAGRYTTPAQDGPSGQWQAWKYTKSWATVTAQIADLPWALPADSGTTATRVVLIRREVHSGQRVIPDPPVTLQLTLSRATKIDPWRVNTIEVP